MSSKAITTISATDASIANLFLLWNDIEQIALALELPKTSVQATLWKREVVNFIREVQINDIVLANKLDKVKAWKDTLGKILEWIKKIANEVDATKWNKNHVELFKFLYHDLIKEEWAMVKTIVNNVNIQQNNYNKEAESNAQAMDVLIGTLPLRKQEEFWEQVIVLAQKFYDEQQRSVIIQQS